MSFIEVAGVTASGSLAPEDGKIDLWFTPSPELGVGVVLWILGIKAFGHIGRGRVQAFSVASGNARPFLEGILSLDSKSVKVELSGSSDDNQGYHILIEGGFLKLYRTVDNLLLLEIDSQHLSPQINSFREMLQSLG